MVMNDRVGVFVIAFPFVVGIGSASACSLDDSRQQRAGEIDPAALAIMELMQWHRGAVPTEVDAATLVGIDADVASDVVYERVSQMAPDGIAKFSYDDSRSTLVVDTEPRELNTGPGVLSDDELREHVEEFLGAWGTATNSYELKFGTLRAVGGEAGAQETREVARTAYASHQLLGVAISEEHLVATFEMDGGLIDITAHWRRVDYDASQLYVPGVATEQGVMEVVAKAMVAQGVLLSDTVDRVEVGTYFRMAPSEGNKGALM